MDSHRALAKILATIVLGKNGVAIALLILAAACALPLLGAVDLDGDGIADAWEWMHGAREADPQDDADADGSNAFEESVAGTDPNDPRSKLGLDHLVQLPDGSLLARWFGEAGKQYVLEGLEDPFALGGFDHETWEQLGGGRAAAQSGVMSLVLPADFSARLHGRLRLAVSDVDSDGDGLNDWEEAWFGLDPAQAQTTPGIDDYGLAVTGLTATNLVEIEIVPATIAETSSAQVVVRRVDNGTMGVQPLRIELSTSGSLVPGRDLNEIPESIFIPMFSNEVAFTITPTGVGFPGPSEILNISIQSAGTAFVAGLASQAVLTVEYTRPIFFCAQLRNALDPFLPTIGTATLAVNPDRTQADLQVVFDGPDTPADLVQLATATNVFFAGLPQRETIHLPAGFLAALEASSLTANVGDFSGVFQLADGSQPFAPPAPLAPWPNASLPSPAEAARFLAQCTFGPTPASIASVESLGFESWIDQQMAIPSTPASRHLPFVANHGAVYPTDQSHRIESWWNQSVRAPDQLRQRVAFALSQIFVISDRDSQIINYPYGSAAYNDLLLDGAFGRYRDLLEAVSLHPMMGMYLSHVRNQPVTSMSFPDENYAREVMQLFSIGLWQLHPDGSRKVGPGGGPIPTYDQTVVEEMARVFTGWSFHSDDLQFGFYSAPVDEVRPMQLYDAFHDDGAKTLFDGVVLPTGQGGEADLDTAMSLLAEHPNTGPFIAFRLIQRLVTSNPSPGYVYRVGQVFRTTNGELGAVVKAILLDPEARDPALVTRPWRGLLREPLLRATGLFRAFDGTTPSTRFRMISPYRTLSQGPLQSPSVFNFFDPEYRLPGEVADAGLRSPVFQILNANNAVLLVNAMFETVETGMPSGVEVVTLDLADEIALASDPAALIDHLDVLLMHGDMSAAMRSSLLAHLAAVPVDMPEERARSAVHLIIVSPEYVVMK